jgi:hypothetical protein
VLVIRARREITALVVPRQLQELPLVRLMTAVAGARYIRQKRAIDGEFVFGA